MVHKNLKLRTVFLIFSIFATIQICQASAILPKPTGTTILHDWSPTDGSFLKNDSFVDGSYFYNSIYVGSKGHEFVKQINLTIDVPSSAQNAGDYIYIRYFPTHDSAFSNTGYTDSSFVNLNDLGNNYLDGGASFVFTTPIDIYADCGNGGIIPCTPTANPIFVLHTSFSGASYPIRLWSYCATGDFPDNMHNWTSAYFAPSNNGSTNTCDGTFHTKLLTYAVVYGTNITGTELLAPPAPDVPPNNCTFDITNPTNWIACLVLPRQNYLENLTTTQYAFVSAKFAVFTDSMNFIRDFFASFNDTTPNTSFTFMGFSWQLMNFSDPSVVDAMATMKLILGLILLLFTVIFIIQKIPKILNP